MDNTLISQHGKEASAERYKLKKNESLLNTATKCDNGEFAGEFKNETE